MARPKEKSLDTPWKKEDQCPCESGLLYGNCCLYHDGAPLVQTPSLLPPGPISGCENSRCYLKSTKNCSEKISKEHYISRRVLSHFGGLKVCGMPWQSKGGENIYTQNDLTSKILCERHNNAFSPLDKAAGKFFGNIFDAMNHATKISVSSRSKFYLVSGDALELWALKTLMGLFYSKISQTNGETMLGKYKFDVDLATESFFGRGIDKPKGIYLKANKGDSLQTNLKFWPLSATAQETLCGFGVKVSGIVFEFLFDIRYARPEYFTESKSFYRPWIVDITGMKRTSRIVLSWRDQRKTANRFNLKIRAHNPKGAV